MPTGKTAKPVSARAGSISTEFVDRLKSSKTFLEILKKTQDVDYAVACTAVTEISKVREMVKFYNQFKIYLKINSDSRAVRANPEKAARDYISNAILTCGVPGTDEAWGPVIRGK